MDLAHVNRSTDSQAELISQHLPEIDFRNQARPSTSGHMPDDADNRSRSSPMIYRPRLSVYRSNRRYMLPV